jgi:iron(II)-dependent oxidoreductase
MGLLLFFCLAACGGGYPAAPARNAEWEVIRQDFGGVEMVLVPEGCFMMGWAEGRRDEQPVHEVCFEQAFWIDRYEVSNAQFGLPGAFPEPNYPRENLPWAEARDFCLRRGARLPTEAEWEYAARGPEAWLYPWGMVLEQDRLVFDRNSNNHTAPVGSRPGGVSWVGAYDMAGNVWEWVSSAYLPYPYQLGDGREDLANPDLWRVYRGGLGSYLDDGPAMSRRFRADPDKRSWFLGFRCAKDVEP